MKRAKCPACKKQYRSKTYVFCPSCGVNLNDSSIHKTFKTIEELTDYVMPRILKAYPITMQLNECEMQAIIEVRRKEQAEFEDNKHHQEEL